MRDNRRAGVEYVQNDLMGALLALKYNINRDLRVATLGIVVQIKDDVVSVKPFPLVVDEPDKTIDCVKLNTLSLVKNDVVLVVFTDRNFLQNLRQIKLNQKLTSLTDNTTLHTDKYGVIVGVI